VVEPSIEKGLFSATRSGQGSFDCDVPSLREGTSPLRMTGLFCAELFCAVSFGPNTALDLSGPAKVGLCGAPGGTYLWPDPLTWSSPQSRNGIRQHGPGSGPSTATGLHFVKDVSAQDDRAFVIAAGFRAHFFQIPVDRLEYSYSFQ